MTDLERHWDAAYADGDEDRSWTEARPDTSLRAIAAVQPPGDAAIIDVGGGSSQLAAELLAAGYDDVTVLDLIPAALRLAQSRLGDDAGRVTWIVGDVLAWQPPRRYALWHDRAVLHFFCEDADRRRYAELVAAAVAPGGHAIIATFAPDGPQTCSGLPVRRSSPEEVAGLLGERFTTVSAEDELHRTPSGAEQRFVRVTLRRA